MTAVIIGISTGLLIVLIFVLLKQFDKKTIYGLVLAGIGFLYVGFTWAERETLVITSIQAILFLFLGYYGVKSRGVILAAGYILHGVWDLSYDFLQLPGVIPPGYDLFCSSLDFTVGIYILVFIKKKKAGLTEPGLHTPEQGFKLHGS